MYFCFSLILHNFRGHGTEEAKSRQQKQWQSFVHAFVFALSNRHNDNERDDYNYDKSNNIITLKITIVDA